MKQNKNIKIHLTNLYFALYICMRKSTMFRPIA